MLSTLKIEEVLQTCFVFDVAYFGVSQNCFVFDTVKLKIEKASQNCFALDLVKFNN